MSTMSLTDLINAEIHRAVPKAVNGVFSGPDFCVQDLLTIPKDPVVFHFLEKYGGLLKALEGKTVKSVRLIENEDNIAHFEVSTTESAIVRLPSSVSFLGWMKLQWFKLKARLRGEDENS